jgi:DNA (cytosine-5)-methyltransferase 1
LGGNATPIFDQLELESGEESWVVSYHARLLRGRAPVKHVPKHLRRITVEEATTLQGFPPGTQFAGSVIARYRQIGNSVPPPLAYAVAVTMAGVLRTLRGTSLQSLAA